MWFRRCGRGLVVCISYKLPGEADGAGPHTTLGTAGPDTLVLHSSCT